jgi:hypothetical protein
MHVHIAVRKAEKKEKRKTDFLTTAKSSAGLQLLFYTMLEEI